MNILIHSIISRLSKACLNLCLHLIKMPKLKIWAKWYPLLYRKSWLNLPQTPSNPWYRSSVPLLTLSSLDLHLRVLQCDYRVWVFKMNPWKTHRLLRNDSLQHLRFHVSLGSISFISSPRCNGSDIHHINTLFGLGTISFPWSLCSLFTHTFRVDSLALGQSYMR